MKRILKIRIPVTQLEVVFKGMDDALDLAEVLLDLERQLNNLKIVSEVKGIGMYPRFHLGGNPYEYKTISYGDTTLQGRAHDTADKSKGIRVSARQRKDSGVPEDVKVQSREGPIVSEEVRIAYIKKMIGHYESGLLIGREVLEAITATLEAPLARVKIALEKEK